MGNSPTVEVYITSADVASGDVVGFFCGHGNQGRLKSRPVPNLKVPGFKKKDIIRDKDLRKFEEIDNHALNAPSSATKSVKSLIRYLVAIAETDVEKVRAFYRWITANISYEVSNSMGGGITLSDPSTVLRRRSANADGYANLFATMCKGAGVPVVTLSGFAKRSDFDPEIPYTPRDKPDHSWNAVFVEEDWRFVDCCWGAGWEDEEGRWNPKFEEFWFLTDPDKFINDHYPWTSTDTKISSNWQLLKQPISLDEYNKIVKMAEVCREWGIDLSHKEPILIFRKEIHITLGASVLVRNITATMETVDRVKMDQYTVVYRFDTLTFSIQCRPPSPGTYILRIFGQRDGVLSHPPKLLLRYILKCTDSNNYVKSLPYVYTHAQTYQCTLHEPNSRELPSKSKVRIRLSSPHLRQVNVENIPLECDDNGTWEGTVQTPQAGETIVIYGSTSDNVQGRFNSLYKFFIV
ncbi:kyphoscoliosis peptidase-like [Crassostrea virginica]